MDRRVFLAVILTAVVIVVTPLLFPGAKRPIPVDSARVDSSMTARTPKKGVAEDTSAPTERSIRQPSIEAKSPESAVKLAQAVTVSDSLAAESHQMTVWYAGEGASPLRVVLTDYQSRDTARGKGPVVLEDPERRLLIEYALQSGDSNVAFASVPMAGSMRAVDGHEVVQYAGTVAGRAATISYTSPGSDSGRYLVHVDVEISGAAPGSKLSISLPSTLASMETDTVDDIRHLAYGYRTASGDVKSLAFAKLDSGVMNPVAGPLEWVALRNKYFLVALVVPDSAIQGATFSGGARVEKLAPKAHATVLIPLQQGRANFELYMGPQEFERLRALGHGLDQVNPYAGWFHSVVQPFATIVTRVLLWMKRSSGLGYGWVIIIFGVVVRLLLWPLNQSAMRTSIRMQRIQPELAEVQKKYKNDPKKQQEALVKLYQAHGMTPFSPMMGCLPMMLPMPILFALYFVFLNTIEFRGVSFLWMHDISAADPYYITPLVMGLSMFALSWIGMRGTPPTAQTRMMSYMMPVVLTFMFFRFAAGLNLYYAVQNIAAIPQQWLLARERAGVARGAADAVRRSKS